MYIRQGASNRAINYHHRQNRSIDELIGITKGILADNQVNESELRFLLQWLETNREAVDTWPGNRIYERLCEAFNDGIIDCKEEKELLDLLKASVGHYPLQEEYVNLSTSLPLDDPQPKIEFVERRFCFTGTFVFGKRKECHQLTINKGGIIKENVVLDLNYLVIGTCATADWAHTSWGRKIEKALQYKQKGCSIKIISEDHWVNHVLEEPDHEQETLYI